LKTEDQEVVEELLSGLPPIRWPDTCTPADEIVAQVLLASPQSSRRIRLAVHMLVTRAASIDQLVSELDVLAIRFGQDGDGETCAALLDVCDRIREWGYDCA
jgi:hypothetical protein